MSSLRGELVAALLHLPPPVVVSGGILDIAAIGHVGRGNPSEKRFSSITYAYVCQMREDMSTHHVDYSSKCDYGTKSAPEGVHAHSSGTKEPEFLV